MMAEQEVVVNLLQLDGGVMLFVKRLIHHGNYNKSRRDKDLKPEL